MATLSLRLPKSLHESAKKMAAQEDISINQLVATALAEKMSALMTGEYLERRAARGKRSKFNAVLKKVPARPPMKGDEL